MRRRRGCRSSRLIKRRRPPEATERRAPQENSAGHESAPIGPAHWLPTGGADNSTRTRVGVTSSSRWRPIRSTIANPWTVDVPDGASCTRATPESLNVRPGEAPPPKVIDESQPLYTIIMERDLGSKRLPSAMIKLGSLVAFVVLAWRLHDRDKRELAARSAYEASVGKR